MNVIVSNRQKGIIDNANIDAIKDLNGLFNVDDLVNKFKNYFFSKMILDATSVVDFATRDVLQKLVDEIGADRLIILLPSTPEPPDEFKKLLIELKIYNFSNNIDEVVKFIEKPNTYENAISTVADAYSNSSDYYVDSSIKDGEDVDEEFEDDVNVESNDTINNNDAVTNNDSDASNDVASGYIDNNSHTSLGDIMSRFNVYNDDTINTKEDNFEDTPEKELVENSFDDNYSETVEQNENVQMETNEQINNSQNEAVAETHNASNNSPIFLNMDGFDTSFDEEKPQEKLIIGFKNVTLHAGSTTLIYLLQKEAKKRNKDLVSIEINKNDFKLFRSSKMISIEEENISDTLNSLRENYILVDLNDCKDDSFCDEIIYLVEPSLIKLNRLMMTDKDTFNSLKDKKVILNQSMLSNGDVSILENEANMKFFFSIGSINDRNDNLVIYKLFDKLLNN